MQTLNTIIYTSLSSTCLWLANEGEQENDVPDSQLAQVRFDIDCPLVLNIQTEGLKNYVDCQPGILVMI